MKEFEPFIEKLTDTTEVLLVVGDFNIWVDQERNPDAKRLLKLMSAYGLSQLINEPTHKKGHTLDHLYINEQLMTVQHNVHTSTHGVTTDHYPCTIRIPSYAEEERKEKIELRQLGKIDMEEFKKDLKVIVDRIITTQDTFEKTYEMYRSSTEKLLDEYAPIITRTRTSRRKQAEWVDEEYKKERAKRRKLERKWKKSKNEEDHERYVDQRSLCAKMSVEKQEKHYSHLIESSANKQKALFDVAAKVLDKKDEKVLPAYTDPVELANEFNEFYIKKIEKLRNSIPQADVNDTPIQGTKFEGEKLDVFAPTTIEELKEIINESGEKTSSEDPLPQAILRDVQGEILPLLMKLVNVSLAEGSIESIQSSVIDPLLKKLGLDPEGRKNYRPVNNLVFLSKLIERVVKRRIDSHMEINTLFNKRGFGYKAYHSTETMMTGVVNEVLTGFDENKCTVMVFLDLSAAFDTIDIDKLINILSEEIGLSGTALKWCTSFLKGRTQRVKIDGKYSEKLPVNFGSVQGAVLGPKFFNIYVRSQLNSGFETSAFADDSNGRKTFSITFQHNVLKNDVSNCIENVIKWMNAMSLKINPDKTEIILFHPKSMKDRVIIGGTMIDGECIRFSKEVKNVGVWLDCNLNLNKHINTIVAHCYKLLKNIGRIRKIISTKHTEMLVHAVITSRLDYCNSLFFNMSQSNIYKLQKVQNAAARLVARRRKRKSISGVIRDLHWLRVESRIVFKILLLTHKVIIGKCSENLQITYKSHCCRPQELLMLETKPAVTKYGRRTFDYVAPRLWNALPLNIRCEEDTDTFKKSVKTLLFNGTEELKKRAFKYN